MKITLVIAVSLADIPKGVSEAKIQEKIEAGIAAILGEEGFKSVSLADSLIEATVEVDNPEYLSKVPAELLEDPTEPVQLDLFGLEAEGNTSDAG